MVLELSSRLESAAKKYEALAADDRVTAALSTINGGVTRKARLGPSARFTDELARWRKEAAGLDSGVIKLRMKGGVPHVDVTLNETHTESMVVDSGAGIVTITSDVAKDLGIVPGPDDPTAKSSIADGQEVDAKIVHLQSVRLAQFSVNDVECAVLPPSAREAECLLGGTFLHHFAYRMDLAAGALYLSQPQGAAQEASLRPGSRPVAAGKPPTQGRAPDAKALCHRVRMGLRRKGRRAGTAQV